MLHFLVTLKISFGAKFFSAFITLYVLMACFVHIKLPLVFKDVGLFRAFSTDTNELSIPTRCVLCLLMVHQISLYILSYDSHNHYNCKSFDRHNHQICAVFRAESNASHFEMPCHSYCISISFLCLHYICNCTVFMWRFRLVKLNILLHSPHWTFTIFPVSF